MPGLDPAEIVPPNEEGRIASDDLTNDGITNSSLLRIQQEMAAASLEQLLPKATGQTERTLLLVKPEAVKYKTMIEARLKKEGFFTLQKRYVHLTPEQASEFFVSERETPQYPRLILYMSAAPVLAICLTKQDAIMKLKKLLGPSNVLEAKMFYPNCMHAIFGQTKDSLRNGLHASEDEQSAEHEIHFFFPNMILEPLWQGERMTDYVTQLVKPALVDGLTEVCKVKPVDPVLWLAEWLLVNNPNKPNQDENILTIPT